MLVEFVGLNTKVMYYHNVCNYCCTIMCMNVYGLSVYQI